MNELSVARRAWILFVLCMAVLLFVFSFTVPYPAAVSMARDTGASQTETTWIIDAVTLLMSIFLLPAGALGDRYGMQDSYWVMAKIIAVTAIGPLFWVPARSQPAVAVAIGQNGSTLPTRLVAIGQNGSTLPLRVTVRTEIRHDVEVRL